jgi:hypothetical protein
LVYNTPGCKPLVPDAGAGVSPKTRLRLTKFQRLEHFTDLREDLDESLFELVDRLIGLTYWVQRVPSPQVATELMHKDGGL